MEKLKATCANCRYFKDTLQDPNSFYHIHNYCSKWDRTFPNPNNSLISDTLIYYSEVADKLFGWHNYCRYDDIELGIASCYCFEQVNIDEPVFMEDGKMKERFETSKKQAIQVLDYLIQEGGYDCSEGWRDFDEEDIAELKERKAKIGELKY